jgi:hypothetical protein
MAEMALGTMQKSPSRRRKVGRDPQRSRITNGSLFAPPRVKELSADGRSAWVRRMRDVLEAHLDDVPNATAAERSIIRRASVLTVELERLEAKFATAGEASERDLDLYQRTAGNLRRLLEAIGLRRSRADPPTPHLHDYLEARATESAS